MAQRQAEQGEMIVDATLPLYEGMPVWPGTSAFVLETEASLAEGDGVNLSRLRMGAHTGTHIDAPSHFIAAGDTIDCVALDALVGPARVFDLTNVDSIDACVLRRLKFEGVERAVFRTRNSNLWSENPQQFHKDYVSIAPEGATWLANRRLRSLGVDYFSVERFQPDSHETHRALLSAGIWLIEGLDLRKVPPGDHWMAALPLPIRGCDGAPARVIFVLGGRATRSR